VKTKFLSDESFELSHLRVIAVKKVQEAGLRAGGAFNAASSQRLRAVLDFREVERQIISPQASPLAHGRRLGRLQVRVTQTSEVAMLLGEAAKLIDDCGQTAGQKLQPL